MKVLLLSRHGETINQKGQIDPPLSDEGKRDAERLAAKVDIATRRLSLTIWSSTAQRAKETASIIKEKIGERVISIEFFEELWSDKKHLYQKEWIEKKISSFCGDALLIVSHAEIAEYPVSLGGEYIPLNTGDCVMLRGNWNLKI